MKEKYTNTKKNQKNPKKIEKFLQNVTQLAENQKIKKFQTTSDARRQNAVAGGSPIYPLSLCVYMHFCSRYNFASFIHTIGTGTPVYKNIWNIQRNFVKNCKMHFF